MLRAASFLGLFCTSMHGGDVGDDCILTCGGSCAASVCGPTEQVLTTLVGRNFKSLCSLELELVAGVV